ncbi:MAG: MgtC/SapB family protein [Alphaproteobacteria bacterium]|nr:MgtC/SapB family protein [Alphaproteobacteria bacterium]
MTDIILRLLAAVAIGMALGLNRDLKGKPTGIRTLGLVSLGAAVVTLGLTHEAHIAFDNDAYSRVLQGVVQGVLTGIGFLGGGVILRSEAKETVRNITTAATVWVTAALGTACAVSDWRILGIGFALAMLLLMFGRQGEKWIERKVGPALPHDDEG